MGAVAPEILDAEVRHARSKRPDNLVAYDCVLRAYQHLWILTLDDNDKALDFLRQAIQLDPDYALAYAYASWADLFRVQLLQGTPLRPLLTEALSFAQRAVELDPSNPLIQIIRAAWQLMIERDFDGAVTRHEDAFRKNPNSVWICGANGFAHSLCREPERALEMFERARRLSPRDSSMFLWLPGGAIAHLLAGRPEQAIQWADDALRLNPRHLISLLLRAAAEMAGGQDDAGRRSVERMRAINPTLDIVREVTLLIRACPRISRAISAVSAPRRNTYTNPPSFPAHLQGSGTNARRDIRLEIDDQNAFVRNDCRAPVETLAKPTIAPLASSSILSAKCRGAGKAQPSARQQCCAKSRLGCDQ